MNQTIKNRIEQINCGEVPDGYRKTEVGIVPKEWETTQISKIFTFKNGLNKEKEAFGHGTPIVNYMDVNGRRGLYAADIKGRVSLSKPEIENYNAKKGDVFFTRTSETVEEIGLSSVLLEDIPEAVFSGFILRARPYNDKINIYYNQYCYSSKAMRHEIIKKSSYTTRALTSGPFLGQVKLNLPTKTEQRRIAEILMKWDDAVELQEKLVNRLLGQSKAIVQRIMKPQAHWASIKLNTILKERKVYEEKNDRYPHVTLSKEGIVDKGDQYNRDFLVKSDDKKYKVTFFNDLCYNPANLKFGVICLNKYGTAIFSPIYVTYEINKQYNPDFIGAILTDGNFINKIRKYEEGTIFERQAVNPKDFLRGKIHVPPSRNEQDDIARLIIKHFENTSLQAQKLEALKKQRKALRQLLLTGIVRV